MKLLTILLLGGVMMGQQLHKGSIIHDSKNTVYYDGTKIVDTDTTKHNLTIGGTTIGGGTGTLCGTPLQFHDYVSKLNVYGAIIYIKDGKLIVEYEKNVEPTEAAKQFFKWVVEYQQYYLIKRRGK